MHIFRRFDALNKDAISFQTGHRSHKKQCHLVPRSTISNSRVYDSFKTLQPLETWFHPTLLTLACRANEFGLGFTQTAMCSLHKSLPKQYIHIQKKIKINLKQWFQYNALKCYWYRAAHSSITQTDILKWVQSFSHVTNWHVSSKLVNRETKWTSVKYFPGLSAQTISITAKILALYAPSSNTDSSKCIFHSLPRTVLMRRKASSSDKERVVF